MSHWNEHRGVTDDLGYLRQAHLFQRFGVGGLDTDAKRDDDHFYVMALKSAGFDVNDFVNHNYMPATDKLVIQSPPGVGLLLAMFPDGFQVIPLYVVCSVVVFIFALFLIGLAPTLAALATCSAFGWASIIFMVNPAKSQLFGCAYFRNLCGRRMDYGTVLLQQQPTQKICVCSARRLSARCFHQL
jgi:hypothetical protein